MDLALIAVGLGLCYFAIQVPLDKGKSRIQRTMGAIVVLTGTFLVLLFSLGGS